VHVVVPQFAVQNPKVCKLLWRQMALVIAQSASVVQRRPVKSKSVQVPV